MKAALGLLVERAATADDRVAIVVYAGAAGSCCRPTPGDEKDDIREAIDALAGRRLDERRRRDPARVRRSREQNFIEGGINRVILATDGDFNVGVSSDGELDAPHRGEARRAACS